MKKEITFGDLLYFGSGARIYD